MAVTVTMFLPSISDIPDIDQVAVPIAVPLPPAEFAHVTRLTPTSSEALPDMVINASAVSYVPAVVGDVIATVGAIVSLIVTVRSTEYPLSFSEVSTAVTEK